MKLQKMKQKLKFKILTLGHSLLRHLLRSHVVLREETNKVRVKIVFDCYHEVARLSRQITTNHKAATIFGTVRLLMVCFCKVAGKMGCIQIAAK